MKILVTGNMGYIGSALTEILYDTYPSVKIIGYDTGFFKHSFNKKFLNADKVDLQYYGDIRDISMSHLENVDSIVHLAAVSNDPIGNDFEYVTSEINHKASIRLVKMAIKARVKSFIFASSCSIYGTGGHESKKETDLIEPLTAYSRSKILTEEEVKNINLESMVFTSLRFATACGWSNRLRLDLVLNDFVACAVSSRNIIVQSDGTPWRPLIDVQDMSRAIVWAINREISNGGGYLVVNTGCNENNFQIKDIAMEVSKQLNDIKISINKNAIPDKRSYSVDFSLFKKLAPNHQPKISLKESIKRLIIGFELINFDDKNFQNSKLIRLNVIKDHISSKRLGQNLRWLNK